MEFAMKKYILIFASMLLIFSLLAGCSKAPATGTIATEAPTAEQTIAATEASVPEKTTVPNETQAAEDIVHEDDATSYYIEVAYADQIARYYTALSEKWDEVKYLENEMSTLPYYYYEGNPLENVGFGFVDLDNDGYWELVIGAIMIGCIYTGMNFLRIGSYYQQLAKGLIIIGAIMLDMAVSKKNR